MDKVENPAAFHTKIPGLKADHQMITPICRANRGTMKAFDEAAQRVGARYGAYAFEEANENVTWHLVLVRDGGDE